MKDILNTDKDIDWNDIQNKMLIKKQVKSYMLDNSDHSMTQEEIHKKLKEDNIRAKEGVIAIRRKLIVESLKARGIDPSTVDIDKIIEETTPEIY